MLDNELVGLESARDITDAMVRAVRDGKLTSGALLPSIRSLADTIGVSPGTIALAYRTLRERGIITSAHGRRSRVAERPAIPRPLQIPLPAGVRNLSTSSPDPTLLPDVASFLTPEIYAPRLYDTGSVEESLHALMTARFAADGIEGQLTAVSGALDGIERILATHLRPGDAVIVEDPQWVSSLSLFRVLGLVIMPVSVDAEGMIPQALEAAMASRHCAAIVITPRAQNPYGSALSRQRALQLGSILERAPDMFVIEDDHASLIAGAPTATITAERRKWAVIRSMSKAIGPDLRVAVMSSDPETADRVQGRLMLGPGWVSHLSQRLVATVLSDCRAVDQIASAEATYARRRETLVNALAGHDIESTGRSGLNVLIPVPEESPLTSYLLTHGWAVRSGEPFRLHAPPFIRVTIAALDEPEAIAFADDLAHALSFGERHRAI